MSRFINGLVFTFQVIGAVIFFASIWVVMNKPTSYMPVQETFFIAMSIGFVVIPRAIYEAITKMNN